jgi:hypothetical protein
LKPSTTFFDYGCGQGSDVRGLQGLGHDADGWDPVYRSEVPKQEADIVNLGYVLNVIEDPAERLEALVDAFRHAKRLLVLGHKRDGGYMGAVLWRALTRANTFQKFEQQELQQYIEDAPMSPLPVAWASSRFSRPGGSGFHLGAHATWVDWTQSCTAGLGGPQTLWKSLYEEHKDPLNAFGS